MTDSWRCSCGTTVKADPLDDDQVLELDGVVHDHDDYSDDEG